LLRIYEKKSNSKKLKNKKFFGPLELLELHLKTSNTHNFWSVGPKNTIFVLPRSLFQGTSSQKVSKNPKIHCIYSSLSKIEKSRFGSLRTLGINEGNTSLPLETSLPPIVMSGNTSGNMVRRKIDTSQ
jgi:hypothetical protein